MIRLNIHDENPFADPVDDLAEQPPRPVYVPPWSLVIDTREQAPWRFTGIPATGKECGGKPGGFVVPKLITGKSLPTGDYSIEGMESLVCIERKSMPDLFACCGRERERFEREFQRMAEMKWSAVVVEADEFAIVHKPPRGTKISPGTVIGTIESWSVRYPTRWFLCHDRRVAEIKAFRLLARFYEHNKPQSQEGA